MISLLSPLSRYPRDFFVSPSEVVSPKGLPTPDPLIAADNTEETSEVYTELFPMDFESSPLPQQSNHPPRNNVATHRRFAAPPVRIPMPRDSDKARPSVGIKNDAIIPPHIRNLPSSHSTKVSPPRVYVTPTYLHAQPTMSSSPRQRDNQAIVNLSSVIRGTNTNISPTPNLFTNMRSILKTWYQKI